MIQHQDGMSKAEGRGQRAEGRGQKAEGKRGYHLPLWLAVLSIFASSAGWAQTSPAAQSLRVTVNSNQDVVQADEGLTLREAIAIVNGTLPLDKLSPAEKRR